MSKLVPSGQARAQGAAAYAQDDIRTYRADVSTESAEWLAGLDEPAGITHLGNGRLRFTASAVAYLRCVPINRDGCIDDNDQIHLDWGMEQAPVRRER